MKEKITLCGDNCYECPRYNSGSEEELKKTAELWFRVGWSSKLLFPEEISCSGCSSHKHCTYELVDCISNHRIEKCNQCAEYPCDKINKMLARSEEYMTKCKEVCSKDEYEILDRAFFHKIENMDKYLQQHYFYCMYLFLYSVGEIPIYFLNILLK